MPEDSLAIGERLLRQATEEGWGESPGFSRLVALAREGKLERTAKGWLVDYFSQRTLPTQKRNPILLGDAEKFRGWNPANIEVIPVPKTSLRTGAMVTDFDLANPFGLKEIRIYGDVPVTPTGPMTGPIKVPADEAIFPSSPYEQPLTMEAPITITRPRIQEAGQAGATARTAAGRAAAGGTPPPTPPTATAAQQPQPKPPADLFDLQDFDEATRIATPSGSAGMVESIPGLRNIFKRINPSALARTAEQRGLIGRHVLRFEARQKAAQVMARVGRLGKHNRIMGRTDPNTGLYVEGPLRGKAPNDVRANAEKPEIARLLNDQQKEYIAAMQGVEEFKLKLFRLNNVDIKVQAFEEGGSYAGRRVVSKVSKNGEVVEMGVVLRKGKSIGSDLGQFKGKVFASQEDALAAGYRFLDEDEALRLNLEQAYLYIADKRFAEWMLENSSALRLLGKGEKGPLADEKSAAALAPKHWSRAVFTGPEADDIARLVQSELDPSISGVLATGAKINAVGRFMVLNGDASPFFIQLFFLAGYNPKAWARSIKGFVNTLFDTTYHSNLIANNGDLLARHRGLITTLRGTEMTEAAQQGGLLNWKLPVTGTDILKPARLVLDPFARAFGAALDTAGIHLARALDEIPGLADDAAKMNEVDAFINSIRGLQSSERLGVSANWRLIEANALLAPQYNRAIATMIWSLTQGGIKGTQARNALRNTLLAIFSTVIAFEIAQYMRDTNNPNRESFITESLKKITPTDPEFMTWKLGDTQVGPGTKVRSLLTLGANSKEYWEDLNPFSGELNRNPAFKFMRGNFAPLAGDAWDVISGYNFIGNPTGVFTDWGEFDFDLSDATNQVLLPNIIPIWTKSALLEGGTVGERALMGGAEFLGLRAYPAGRKVQLQEISKELQLGDYDDLLPLEKDRISRIAVERFGQDEYRGVDGHLRKRRDDADDQYIDVLTNKAKGFNWMVDQDEARKSHNNERKERHAKLFGGWDREKQRYSGGLYDQLYDMDEQIDEPDPTEDITKHDVWRYYELFNDATKEDGTLDFNVLDQEEAKFWASLDNAERIDNVLDSIRILEDRLPAEYKSMRHAQRYAGSLKLSLRDLEPISYYDLDRHPLVMQSLVELSGQNQIDVESFLNFTYYQQQARVDENPEGKYALIKDALDEAKKDDGILAELQTEFIVKANNETSGAWLWGMFTAGYDYRNHKTINANLRESFDKIPNIEFRALHRELLYSMVR